MWGWIEVHPGTAAWAQALLTIAALAIAIYIPWKQRRSEALREVALHRRANVGIAALIEKSSAELLRGSNGAVENPDAYFEIEDNRAEIDALLDELNRLPPGAVDYALSVEIALYRVAARRARSVIDEMERDYAKFGSVGPIGADSEIALAILRDQADALTEKLQES